MSTLEDFENAPVGATATHPDGIRVVKREGYETAYLPWLCTTYGEWFSNEEMAEGGYTLNPAAPTNSREALELAWELGHEVKEGQTIPEGTRYLEFLNSELREYTAPISLDIAPALVPKVRTLEPLPDPKPDWLNAPAVLANVDAHDEFGERIKGVFYPAYGNRWKTDGTEWTFHWNELHEVTPLYPKEDQEPRNTDTPNDAPRTYSACLNYDGPWGTRLGGDPA